jgi:transposase-like protein
MDSENLPLQTKKQRSIIHNYFTLDEKNNKYNCNSCNKSYKIPKDGSTSTLWKHFKTKHSDLYAEAELSDAMNRLEISENLVYIYFNLFIIILLIYNTLLYYIIKILILIKL